VALLSVIAITGLATYAILFSMEAGTSYEAAPVFLLGDLHFSYAQMSIAPAFAYAGYVFYSLGLVGVSFLWNLGTMHFSKDPSESFLCLVTARKPRPAIPA